MTNLLVGMMAFTIFLCPARAEESPVIGEAEDGEAEERCAYVSLIALGAMPAKRYELSSEVSPGGDRLPVMVPLEIGEVPPSRLYYRQEQEGEKPAYGNLSVGFNSSAGINKMKPAKRRSLFFRNEKTGRDYVKFMELPPLEKNTQNLFLLTQPSKSANYWLDRPTVRRLNLSSGDLSNTKMYIVNLSSESIYVRVNREKVMTLRTGEAKAVGHLRSSGMVRLLAMKKEKISGVKKKNKPHLVSIMRTGAKLRDGVISVYSFYNANPSTNSGKTVGVCKFSVKRLTLAPPDEGATVDQ